MRSSFRMMWLSMLAFAGGHAAAQVSIPIVHRWGDLENAPKLTAVPLQPTVPNKSMPDPGPVSFQIGVSSDQGAVNNPVILYFLGSTDSGHPYTPEERGVYWLQIDGTAQAADKTTMYAQDEPVPKGTYFYAQAIPFLSAGDHVLELIKPFVPGSKSDALRQVLARVAIHVEDASGDLWYPFWMTEAVSGGAASARNQDGTLYATESVFNPQGDPAIPNTAQPNWYSGFPAPDQMLPALVPADAVAPSAQLKMVNSTLVINFDPKIEGFFPDDYFLTRWWVNDQPVRLDPKVMRPGQARALAASTSVVDDLALQDLGALVWYTREVHFALNFKPEWIGAKKGDRIGVQFLYCPDGFMFLRTGSPEFCWEHELPDKVFSQTSFSERSNRVDFVYSGDPLHPQP